MTATSFSPSGRGATKADGAILPGHCVLTSGHGKCAAARKFANVCDQGLFARP
jgi:hypothetical protein